MCGIAGFVDFSGESKQSVLKRMTDSLFHRGPDDQGYDVIVSDNITIGLGQCRLSIIDLSPKGHQPMLYEHLEVVFNGEIYNYKEIKKELEPLGYEFTSGSDTEVILKAYHAWGIACLEKFIGMFAIILVDRKKNEVFLVRDRAGVKPLYYYQSAQQILFSSELKALQESPFFNLKIDHSALALYFKYGYIPAPHTIFANTHKLKPGHYLNIKLDTNATSLHCYWDVLTYYNKPKLDVPLQEAIEKIEDILISACNYRMVADVPVGVFLSGGYDSSTVSALLQNHSGQKIKTFSIGFYEDEFNEAKHAKKVADHLGTDHIEHYCSVKEAQAIIPTLGYIYDEPFGDSSAIPTILVSQVAVKNVKVALSADAGDEIFAGYGNYFYFLKQYNRIASLPSPVKASLAAMIPALRPFSKWARNFSYNIDTRLGKLPGLLKSGSPAEFISIINQYFTDTEISDLIKSDITEKADTAFNDFINPDYNDFINTQLANGYKTFLVDDILTKVDRATMSVSLEGREPLLDHRIVEYAAQLPSNYKYRNGISKYPLKEIAHKYIPKPLLDRPKMGFSIPVEQWLKGDLRYLLEHYFSYERVAKGGILNPQAVQRIKNDFLGGKRFNFSKVWFLLMFQMWAERWLEKKQSIDSRVTPAASVIK